MVLGWLAAEFTTPDNKGFVQQTALFQVRQKAPTGWSISNALFGQLVFYIAVMVPAASPNLNYPHAPFNQLTGNQHLAALRVAVHLLYCLWFLIDIKGARSRGLHLERNFG